MRLAVPFLVILLGMFSGGDNERDICEGIEESLQCGISNAQLFGGLTSGDISQSKALQNSSKTFFKALNSRLRKGKPTVERTIQDWESLHPNFPEKAPSDGIIGEQDILF